MGRKGAGRKTTRRRRRNSGFKLINAASAYVSLDAITRTLFRTDPIKFFTGWTSAGHGAKYVSGAEKLSLNELFNYDKYKGTSDYAQAQTLGGQIMKNVQDGWMMGVVQLVAAGALPKIANKLPGRPVQKTNKMLKDVGVDFVTL